jgi:hypothetical protein
MVDIYDVGEVIRPEMHQWVRIKTGPYQADIGLVDMILSGDQTYVMLIPRLDPNAGKEKKKDKNGKVIANKLPFWTKHP